MSAPTVASTRDFAARWPSALALWGAPVAVLAAVIGVDGWVKTLAWTVALAWMGIGCLRTVRRWSPTLLFHRPVLSRPGRRRFVSRRRVARTRPGRLAHARVGARGGRGADL